LWRGCVGQEIRQKFSVNNSRFFDRYGRNMSLQRYKQVNIRQYRGREAAALAILRQALPEARRTNRGYARYLYGLIASLRRVQRGLPPLRRCACSRLYRLGVSGCRWCIREDKAAYRAKKGIRRKTRVVRAIRWRKADGTRWAYYPQTGETVQLSFPTGFSAW
jgi:hypothetical protein